MIYGYMANGSLDKYLLVNFHWSMATWQMVVLISIYIAGRMNPH